MTTILLLVPFALMMGPVQRNGTNIVLVRKDTMALTVNSESKIKSLIMRLKITILVNYSARMEELVARDPNRTKKYRISLQGTEE